MPAHPIITLLTDFGLVDGYVGVMHGVMLGRCPSARIVDLSHAIEAGDVRRAGYVLADHWRYFPRETVHVAVVDPGVGSDRAILAARVADQVLIAPDNGLLTAAFAETPPQEVRRVSNGVLFLPGASRTFHGRDIFAPVAGALAEGLDFADVGPVAEEWITLDLPRPIEHDDGSIEGAVIHVDRFGNLITNIPGHRLPLLPRIAIAGRTFEGLAKAYADVQPGEALVLIGSTRRVEIAVNQGSAAEQLNAGIGATVHITPGRDL